MTFFNFSTCLALNINSSFIHSTAEAFNSLHTLIPASASFLFLKVTRTVDVKGSIETVLNVTSEMKPKVP